MKFLVVGVQANLSMKEQCLTLSRATARTCFISHWPRLRIKVICVEYQPFHPSAAELTEYNHCVLYSQCFPENQVSLSCEDTMCQTGGKGAWPYGNVDLSHMENRKAEKITLYVSHVLQIQSHSQKIF